MLRLSLIVASSKSMTTTNCNYSPPVIYKIKNIRTIEKNVQAYANKINTLDNPCSTCKGFGYVACLNCHDGCWRCENTGLKECIYCGGSGKGGNKNSLFAEKEYRLSI